MKCLVTPQPSRTSAAPARLRSPLARHWLSDPLPAMSELCADYLCTSALEQLCELEGFLTIEDQILERHFDSMSRLLHSLTGSTAMIGLETLSSAFNELDQSMKRAAKEPSGVSGVTHSHPMNLLLSCPQFVVAPPEPPYCVLCDLVLLVVEFEVCRFHRHIGLPLALSWDGPKQV